MGVKEFQQAQSKTESKVGASQAVGEAAAPACTGLPVPHTANRLLHPLLPSWS